MYHIYKELLNKERYTCHVMDVNTKKTYMAKIIDSSDDIIFQSIIREIAICKYIEINSFDEINLPKADDKYKNNIKTVFLYNF